MPVWTDSIGNGETASQHQWGNSTVGFMALHKKKNTQRT